MIWIWQWTCGSSGISSRWRRKGTSPALPSGYAATSAVVRAQPDGHTLLLCGPVHTINTTLFPNLEFNFMRDIAPVASIARVPLVVEVHPAVPARTLPELIAYARAHPGRLRVAYAGNGTP